MSGIGKVISVVWMCDLLLMPGITTTSVLLFANIFNVW